MYSYAILRLFYSYAITFINVKKTAVYTLVNGGI